MKHLCCFVNLPTAGVQSIASSICVCLSIQCSLTLFRHISWDMKLLHKTFMETSRLCFWYACKAAALRKNWITETAILWPCCASPIPSKQCYAGLHAGDLSVREPKNTAPLKLRPYGAIQICLLLLLLLLFFFWPSVDMFPREFKN